MFLNHTKRRSTDMGKNILSKKCFWVVLLTLMLSLMPISYMGHTLTVAAATKNKPPGAITNLKEVTKGRNYKKIVTSPTSKRHKYYDMNYDICLKWNKAQNAKGYQIRVYSGKKLVKTNITTGTAFIIKDLRSSTKYTIKVRAYNTIKGKKMYGAEKKITKKTYCVNPGFTRSSGSELKREYKLWRTSEIKTLKSRTKYYPKSVSQHVQAYSIYIDINKDKEGTDLELINDNDPDVKTKYDHFATGGIRRSDDSEIAIFTDLCKGIGIKYEIVTGTCSDSSCSDYGKTKRLCFFLADGQKLVLGQELYLNGAFDSDTKEIAKHYGITFNDVLND